MIEVFNEVLSDHKNSFHRCAAEVCGSRTGLRDSPLLGSLICFDVCSKRNTIKATFLSCTIIIQCIHYDGIVAKYIRYRY